MHSQPIARRSFSLCSTVLFSWNNGSIGLLALVQSDVDKTNQSYFGETKLNYLTTDGMHEGLVPLRKDGPVHDVNVLLRFSICSCLYLVTVFDKKCKPLMELGQGPYNTLRWNPKEYAFWDVENKKRLGSTKAERSATSR